MSARWRRSRAVPQGQRRSGLPPEAYPSSTVEPADDAGAPSAEDIEHLLEGMRDLRLTLVADLSAAAAAVEADSERVALEIVESDRQELLSFLRRSAARLEGEPAAATAGATPPARSASWRRRTAIALPAVPLVGALAMSAAAAAGLLPLPTHHADRPVHVQAESQTPVSATFKNFETVLAGDPNASQVVAAASALHKQIAALIATAPQNPGGVTEVAKLLQLEQALLLRTQAPGSKLVLAQSRRLAAQLQTIAAYASAQPTPASVPTSPSSTPQHSTSPRPHWSPSSSSQSPKPTTKPSSSPSSTPSSSPSSDDTTGHIPTIGG